jgi:methionyl-tRNA formyltransferase
MGPAPFATRGGQPLKIHKTRVAQEERPSARPGEVLEVTNETFQVACGQGVLEVLEVQPESRSRQKVAEYLRGYPVKAGDLFE